VPWILLIAGSVAGQFGWAPAGVYWFVVSLVRGRALVLSGRRGDGGHRVLLAACRTARSDTVRDAGALPTGRRWSPTAPAPRGVTSCAASAPRARHC